MGHNFTVKIQHDPSVKNNLSTPHLHALHTLGIIWIHPICKGLGWEHQTHSYLLDFASTKDT